MTDEQPEVKKRPSQEDVFASTSTNKAEFVHEGPNGLFQVKLEYYDITRKMRYQALEEATAAYKQKFPDAEEAGILPSVMEREMACQVIKKWNLPLPPRQGWDRLTDDELADRILKETGIEDAVKQTKEENKEVEEAKN